MSAASDQHSLLLKGNPVMSEVGEYALSVIVTVLACTIVSDLVQDPGLNRILKMISGLVLTMTLVNPVFHLDFSYRSDWDLPVMESASAAAEDSHRKVPGTGSCHCGAGGKAPRPGAAYRSHRFR